MRPPTIRSEYVSLQPHLAHFAPADRLYICCTTRPSFSTSVALSVHPTASPSYKQSVNPPVTSSMTRQSTTPPVRPAKRPSDHLSLSDHLYTILPCLSGCTTSSDHTSTIYTYLSDHPPLSHHLYITPISLSACLSSPDCLTATMTRLPIRPSSPMIHHTQDSIHSLAVVNGELMVDDFLRDLVDGDEHIFVVFHGGA